MPRQTFFSSGTFNVPAEVDEVDVLVVGGGGGGGMAGSAGGAGGAGQVRWETGVSVTPEGTVSVTVGGGGAGATATGSGSAGSSSAFGAVTAVGGGAGGGGGSGPAGSGASGGGGPCTGTNTGGDGTAGNDGGDGFVSGNRGGGGGGGAGAAGGNGSNGVGGSGGAGSDMSAEVGGDVGAAGWFGGGGGGGTRGTTAGQGAAGGGNGGTQSVVAQSGTANTGSGGGGGGAAGDGSSSTDGGSGGSGVVIVIWDEFEPPEPEVPAVVSGVSGGSLTNPTTRAAKSQHWQWWNPTHSRWDAVMPTSTGWRLVTDVSGSPVLGTTIDSRQAARIDTFFEPSQGARGRLYVAAGHTSQSRVSRYDLQANGGYTIVGSSVNLPSAFSASDGDASPLVVYRTPGGQVWLSRAGGSNVTVGRSTDDGASWSNAAVISGLSESGVAMLTHIGTQLLMVVTLNGGGGRFVRRIAQNAGSITSGNWTSESLPALPGGITSDDHCSIVQVGGHVYFVSKTEGSASSGTPLMYLQHRDRDGTWGSPITVRPGPDDGESRPSIVSTGSVLRFGFGDFGSPMNAQALTIPRDTLTPGSASNLFTDGNFGDGVVVPRVAAPSSGLLWLAHDRTTGAIWRLLESVPGGEGSGLWLITSGAPVALSPHLITSGSPAGLVPHIIS